MDQERTSLWDEAGFDALPKGVAGMIHSVAVYNNNLEQILSKVQAYLGVPETGKIDEKTCTEAENMLQLKGSVEFLNELGSKLCENERNGVRYRLSQFMYIPSGFRTIADGAQYRTSFHASTYGEIITEDGEE